MSTITVTVNVDTDNQTVLDRAAAELASKVEALDLTLDGVTTQTGHTVTVVKASLK